MAQASNERRKNMRLFKLTGKHNAGWEFEVEDDATEEEIAQAAADCFLEHSDYGWEEVDDKSA